MGSGLGSVDRRPSMGGESRSAGRHWGCICRGGIVRGGLTDR